MHSQTTKTNRYLIMNICIVGLGLIGGSFARAIKEYTDNKVYGIDMSMPTLLAAKTAKAIDGIADDDILRLADLTIISLYPEATVEFLRDKAAIIKKGSTVIDTCGVKRPVCGKCEEIAHENGFCFIGGHPMAGSQFSGFSHSRSTMFRSSTMLLCPADGEDIATVENLRNFLLTLGSAPFSLQRRRNTTA